MHSASVEAFQSKIFDFYEKNGRSFPWRLTTDRYAVMVSEVMLQQTQVERVVPRFIGWMERFPDLHSLASASLREVLELWSGLGYNARGRRLHSAASMIVEHHGAEVPSEPSLLVKLPGIGAYTSRSIPVFADNRDIAAVDTNIRRVLIHDLRLPESITPAGILEVAGEVLPHGRSRDWHNALMDFGALVLTGKKTGIAPLTRQSRFKGSRRWYRGALLRDMLASGELSRQQLEERYLDCPWGIGSLVDALVMESMIEEYGVNRMLRIAGESGDRQ
ncbi:MAG: A/G-specific adenine glycosylase [Chlorobiaceae bacterium]|jgi:A/G-specific adenine glycosylase|nr:A/G-specific adenine glycosylase [Chlorobiaceae bacterium]